MFLSQDKLITGKVKPTQCEILIRTRAYFIFLVKFNPDPFISYDVCSCL